MDNPKISRSELEHLIQGVVASFSDITQKEVLKDILFNRYLERIHSLKDLLETDLSLTNKYESSILNRVSAVKLVLESHKRGNALELKTVWPLIYSSLMDLDEHDVVSSIGSQGFLSIPLFRLDMGEHSFEFLRLHIWDRSFEQFIDKEKANNFTIHSHQFHANSWIFAGEVFNTEVLVEPSLKRTGYNLFNIHWNNTKNEANQRTSVAVNSLKSVDIRKKPKQIFRFGDSYELEAGEYHISGTNEAYPISATLFLFSSYKSRVKKSNVLGPSAIAESEINRKVVVNPKPSLIELNRIITHGG